MATIGNVALINNHSIKTGTGRYAFDLYRGIEEIRPSFVDFYYQIRTFLDLNEIHKLLSLNPDIVAAKYRNIGYLKNVKNLIHMVRARRETRYGSS